MKKTMKSLMTLILAFIILLVNANVAFAFELFYPDYNIDTPVSHDAVFSPAIDLSQYFDFQEFNDYVIEQLKVIDCTTKADSSSSTLYGFIDISQFNIPYSSEVWKEMTNYIWYNSPELFRIYSLGCSQNYQTKTIANLIFAEYYSKEDYSVMLDNMRNEADKLLTGIKGNNNLSDVEKALLLHDRLALHCQYDYDNYLANNIPESSYNAYGVLVLREAVCKGYALAYDYLLEQAGIKAVYCSSDAINHAWNIVYINNTPYHVDVTWDDPTWDTSGKVLHKNFLRSTQGLISTGHIKSGSTTIDYDSTPVDTTYDNYFWQKSQTAFQLLDDEIYFVNNNTNTLNLLKSENGEDAEVLTELCPQWTVDGGYYSNNTKLICDSEYLYYTSPDTIFKFNVETNTTEEFFKPDLSSYDNYNWIYGLEYSNCKIVYEINNSPNYTSTTKKNNSHNFVHHVSGNWVTTKKPTTEASGEKQNLCKLCNIVLQSLPIDKLSLSTTENSVIDNENSVVFAKTNNCQRLNDILEFDEDTDYEFLPSLISGDYYYIGTGTVVEIYEDNEKIAEYTIVVNGDLNGDSICDVLDTTFAELCATNNIIPNEIECYAANGMAKDSINFDSLQYVVNTALGE